MRTLLHGLVRSHVDKLNLEMLDKTLVLRLTLNTYLFDTTLTSEGRFTTSDVWFAISASNTVLIAAYHCSRS